MNLPSKMLCLAILTLAAAQARAEVTATDVWARATPAREWATGVYMKLRSSEDLTLINAASPAANIVEIHMMTTVGNVVAMRSIDEVALPAGKTVELKPGAYHVMLMELVKPLAKGDRVPITLTFQGEGGKRSTLEITAEVRATSAAPAKP